MVTQVAKGQVWYLPNAEERGVFAILRTDWFARCGSKNLFPGAEVLFTDGTLAVFSCKELDSAKRIPGSVVQLNFFGNRLSLVIPDQLEILAEETSDGFVLLVSGYPTCSMQGKNGKISLGYDPMGIMYCNILNGTKELRWISDNLLLPDNSLIVISINPTGRFDLHRILGGDAYGVIVGVNTSVDKLGKSFDPHVRQALRAYNESPSNTILVADHFTQAVYQRLVWNNGLPAGLLR